MAAASVHTKTLATLLAQLEGAVEFERVSKIKKATSAAVGAFDAAMAAELANLAPAIRAHKDEVVASLKTQLGELEACQASAVGDVDKIDEKLSKGAALLAKQLKELQELATRKAADVRSAATASSAQLVKLFSDQAKAEVAALQAECATIISEVRLPHLTCEEGAVGAPGWQPRMHVRAQAGARARGGSHRCLCTCARATARGLRARPPAVRRAAARD